MNFELSNGVLIPLKVSVWVVDEDRYSNLLAEKPKSVIWQMVALIWVCHLNACRYLKQEPQTNTDELELRVDELYSTKDGKKYIADLSASLAKEISALNEESEPEEKKSQTAKQKKPIGKR